MKRKVSIMLFGVSFLIAILGETYLLNVARPHIFSIIGIGIVVILTGYLFFDSIWEYISSSLNKRKELLLEEIIRQETEKWDSRYTELVNIQKATYTALKKNHTKLEEQIEELSDGFRQITQLQNKTVEGQMKALNIAVNYSKEHTKELLESIKEMGMNNKHIEQSSTIESHQEVNESKNEKAESEIKPIYDDPNAALTADEISNLFKNYGG
jgi:translation initiation factor 2 alpha subunit (eIF-2alpha)